MCRYKYVSIMYTCTPSVCFKRAYTRNTHLREHGAAHGSQEHWQTEAGRGPARANAATQLPLVSEICPFVIKATSFECLMYVLKIKFIFRNEAFPVFHYQQFKKKKKIHSHKLFCYFCHSSSQLRLFTFFFSEGKYQAHSGSNCMLKPEC